MKMTCARNALVASHFGLASTSAIVTVRWKVPLIPLYEPVPEPPTIGVVPATVTVPEHVPGSDGKCRNALTILLPSAAMLNQTSPGSSPG